ncbi:MAG: hypothetical protein ABI599_07410 [Flavobacteriales bacterium]
MLLVNLKADASEWDRRQGRAKRLVNHHATHYFMLPSAIPLERGEGYFKSTLIALNSAAYGCSDKFSLGAGIHLPSIFSKRDGGPVWYANARLSGPVSDMLHIGLTGTYLRAVLPVSRTEPDVIRDVPLGFGTAMAMATIGSDDHQLTVAVGATHDGQHFGRGPLVTLAGSTRLFPNVCVVTEHWLFIDPDATWPLHSLGIRVLGEDMALDFGIAYERTLAKKTLGIGLPFASIVFNF